MTLTFREWEWEVDRWDYWDEDELTESFASMGWHPWPSREDAIHGENGDLCWVSPLYAAVDSWGRRTR